MHGGRTLLDDALADAEVRQLPELALRRGALVGLRGDGLGPVDPSFRALSGRLKFTVRRHKFNTDSFSCGVQG